MRYQLCILGSRWVLDPPFSRSYWSGKKVEVIDEELSSVSSEKKALDVVSTTLLEKRCTHLVEIYEEAYLNVPNLERLLVKPDFANEDEIHFVQTKTTGAGIARSSSGGNPGDSSSENDDSSPDPITSHFIQQVQSLKDSARVLKKHNAVSPLHISAGKPVYTLRTSDQHRLIGRVISLSLLAKKVVANEACSLFGFVLQLLKQGKKNVIRDSERQDGATKQDHKPCDNGGWWGWIYGSRDCGSDEENSKNATASDDAAATLKERLAENPEARTIRVITPEHGQSRGKINFRSAEYQLLMQQHVDSQLSEKTIPGFWPEKTVLTLARFYAVIELLFSRANTALLPDANPVEVKNKKPGPDDDDFLSYLKHYAGKIVSCPFEHIQNLIQSSHEVLESAARIRLQVVGTELTSSSGDAKKSATYNARFGDEDDRSIMKVFYDYLELHVAVNTNFPAVLRTLAFTPHNVERDSQFVATEVEDKSQSPLPAVVIHPLRGPAELSLLEDRYRERNLCVFIDIDRPTNKQQWLEAIRDTWGTADVYLHSRYRHFEMDFIPVGFANPLLTVPNENDNRDLLYFWAYLMKLHGSWLVPRCRFLMHADPDAYVNVPMIEERMRCLDDRKLGFYGVVNALNMHPHDPVEPGQTEVVTIHQRDAGYILTRELASVLGFWAPFCAKFYPAEPNTVNRHVISYILASCLYDMGKIQVQNYADEKRNFVHGGFGHPVMEYFRWQVNPILRKCLYVVGPLDTPKQLREVHGNITWANWHQGVDCTGDTDIGNFEYQAGKDGVKQKYYEPDMRLAIWKCGQERYHLLDHDIVDKYTRGQFPRQGEGFPGGAFADFVVRPRAFTGSNSKTAAKPSPNSTSSKTQHIVPPKAIARRNQKGGKSSKQGADERDFSIGGPQRDYSSISTEKAAENLVIQQARKMTGVTENIFKYQVAPMYTINIAQYCPAIPYLNIQWEMLNKTAETDELFKGVEVFNKDLPSSGTGGVNSAIASSVAVAAVRNASRTPIPQGPDFKDKVLSVGLYPPQAVHDPDFLRQSCQVHDGDMTFTKNQSLIFSDEEIREAPLGLTTENILKAASVRNINVSLGPTIPKKLPGDGFVNVNLIPALTSTLNKRHYQLQNYRANDVIPDSILDRMGLEKVPIREPEYFLCIFVPVSFRKLSYIETARAAMDTWARNTTDVAVFFLEPPGKVADNDHGIPTIVWEEDLETDYTHLPLRSYRWIETAAKNPTYANMCHWYMKADADSHLHIQGLIERLSCFQDSREKWFLGVPQLAEGRQGKATQFNSGGAGYFLSRGLLKKAVGWMPYCILESVRGFGGSGMEDVLISACLQKWGHVFPVQYGVDSDFATDVRRHERFATKEQNAHKCHFVTHALTSRELRRVHRFRYQGLCPIDMMQLSSDSTFLQYSNTGDDSRTVKYRTPEFRALWACGHREAKRSGPGMKCGGKDVAILPRIQESRTLRTANSKMVFENVVNGIVKEEIMRELESAVVPHAYRRGARCVDSKGRYSFSRDLVMSNETEEDYSSIAWILEYNNNTIKYPSRCISPTDCIDKYE